VRYWTGIGWLTALMVISGAVNLILEPPPMILAGIVGGVAFALGLNVKDDDRR
jgi:hypothetical protein